jgi:RNA polymerase sigma-70 factor (ECF subfamily)
MEEMTPSDARAIEASITDPAAFAAVFDRHATTILRFLARRVEPADAENLLGEVFRVAFERRCSYDTAHDSARPWLYGIATNLVARHRRSEARRLRAMASLAARRADAHGDDVGERAADAVDADQSWGLLVDAVNDLPDGERHALLLYAWEELSYEDVASALGVPVGTVRSRISRARARLRAARPPHHDTEESAT